ncbi:CAAX family protease [Ligilactobacillus araffinosus DSM 20653]|uniref:CAAX family protease n=2 Tax=Ligilactobacillus araffinosus TaxID=147809 RepID=A0A0R1ZP96_9LACO|nr:CAAX family protease [Ligilactobacillus araffinosus DSM 20653]
MMAETCYNTSKFTITKEVELMAIEKNSLSILIGYLALMIAQMLAQKICWGTQMLYPVLTVIGLLGALIIWKLNQKYSYQNTIEEKRSNLKKIILWGLSGALLIILGQAVTLTLVHVLFHQSLISQNTNALITIFRHSPIYLLDIVITTPIVEELIFRKVFFGNLTYYFKPWIAAIISSFLFVIAHHDSHFLTYFVMGCIFEFIYYKAHDIRAAMIAHAGLNLITLLLWGIH